MNDTCSVKSAVKHACSVSQYGCCPNSNVAALKTRANCRSPSNECAYTIYGCCSHTVTPRISKGDTCSKVPRLKRHEGKEEEGSISYSRLKLRLDTWHEGKEVEESFRVPMLKQFQDAGHKGRVPRLLRQDTGHEGKEVEDAIKCEDTKFGCCPNSRVVRKSSSDECLDCNHNKYGCCPNSDIARTSATDNCFVNRKNIGGCANTLYGCCYGSATAAADKYGYNCFDCIKYEELYVWTGIKAGCASSKYGCCPNSCVKAKTSLLDKCL